VPARWAWGRVGWLSDRGTASPGIQSAGPWGLGKYCRPVGPGEELGGSVTGGLRPPASTVPARWAWGKLCRPVGPEEELWGLSDRGTSSPGIHCAGPLGLKKYCRPAGHEEELCRPVGHREPLSAGRALTDSSCLLAGQIRRACYLAVRPGGPIQWLPWLIEPR
jgi:hypothetical protein